MTSVLVPVVYVVVLVGSLYIFSQFYRKRAAGRIRDPWWPVHPERDVYISLLQQIDPPAPEYILKAALLRRAVADVTRIHNMREDKQAATVLVQKGSVGDDLLVRLQAAEKELETEILEVVGEANSFKEGWGSYIFQTASEMLANEKTRELYTSLPKLKSEMAQKYDRQKRTKAIESPVSLTSQSVASTPHAVPKSDSLAPPPTPQSAVTNDGEEPTTPLSPSSRTKKNKKRK
ncbi:translocation protein sec66 [Hysterangium stoloniferum]|nr:translocation protein sec66 [Hysterangium stoloniferum]